MPSLQSRGWVFTINNPDEHTEETLSGIVPDSASYLVYGRERGESGTFHLQGYIQFERKRARGRVVQLLGGHAFVEPRRGTVGEAVTYCKKDGDFSEFGCVPSDNQGQRTDLGPLVQQLRDGKRLREVALVDPATYCRYRSGLRDISTFVAKGREGPPTVFYVSGEPGTGKSRWAHGFGEPSETWSYPGEGWFDGYDGQKIAIFDDFGDDVRGVGERGITYTMFLRLLDRYPIQVPVKGGFVQWVPETIIITSNRDLSLVYAGDPRYVKEAIERRVTEVKKF